MNDELQRRLLKLAESRNFDQEQLAELLAIAAALLGYDVRPENERGRDQEGWFSEKEAKHVARKLKKDGHEMRGSEGVVQDVFREWALDENGKWGKLSPEIVRAIVEAQSVRDFLFICQQRNIQVYRKDFVRREITIDKDWRDAIVLEGFGYALIKLASMEPKKEKKWGYEPVQLKPLEPIDNMGKVRFEMLQKIMLALWESSL